MAPVEPRYEYRVWGSRLEDVAARFRSVSLPKPVQITTEVYLVAPTVSHVNPKIRHEVLDIKVLLGVVDGLERWEPGLKAGFPLDDGTLATEVFPLLGMTAPPLHRPSYALDQFLDEIVRPHADLQAVEIHKRRESFVVHDCMAELADVAINGFEQQTAALESADPAALSRAVRLTKIDARPNTNYPTAIKHLIGWTAEDASAAWPGR